MSEQSKQRVSIQLTDAPAPWMPGLYSVQLIPKNERDPSVTVYRNDVDEARVYLRRRAEAGGSKWLLLRHTEHAWDVYGADGKLKHLCNEVAEYQRSELATVVDVDLDMLDVQTIAATGIQHTRLCAAVGHAGASAASLSNFVIMCRDLLIDAPPKDVEHFTIVEGASWACRVMGLYGDMSRLSMKTVDRWLDRYRRLAADKPLNPTHYTDALVKHLSNARAGYVAQVVDTAMELVGATEAERTPLRFFMMEYHFVHAVASYLVSKLGEQFRLGPGGVEVLRPDDIVAAASDIAREVRRLVNAPRRKAVPT